MRCSSKAGVLDTKLTLHTLQQGGLLFKDTCKWIGKEPVSNYRNNVLEPGGTKKVVQKYPRRVRIHLFWVASMSIQWIELSGPLCRTILTRALILMCLGRSCNWLEILSVCTHAEEQHVGEGSQGDYPRATRNLIPFKARSFTAVQERIWAHSWPNRKEINIAYRKFFIGFPSISGRQAELGKRSLLALFFGVSTYILDIIYLSYAGYTCSEYWC